jgi:WD40 repeat protein
MAETPHFDKATDAWTLPWDPDWATAVAFLGPSRRLAAGNNLGDILVWELPEKPDAAAPQPARLLQGHTNVVTRLLSSPDGRWLISSSDDHTIRYWDMDAAPKGEATVALNARTRADLIAHSSSKVPAAMEAKVSVFSAAQVLDAHKEWIGAMAMTPDGQTLISGDDAGQIIVWDRPTGKELRRWKTKGWAYGIALSPDAKQAFVSERLPLVFDSGRYNGVKLWDATKGEVQHDMTADYKDMFIAAAAFSPDGKVLALARGGEAGEGPTGKVFLVDPATGKKTRELTPGHLCGATDLAFHRDGKHFASSGRDTQVRIWNVEDGSLVKELGKPRGGQFKDWICAVSFSADGLWLAGADMAGAVQVWSF